MGILDISKNEQVMPYDKDFYDKVTKFIKDVFDKNKSDKAVKRIINGFFNDIKKNNKEI